MRYAGHHMEDSAVADLDTLPYESAEPEALPVAPPCSCRRSEMKHSGRGLRVELSSAGTFVSLHGATEKQLENGRKMALAIRRRIESRLMGRVRELAIRVEDDTVVLEGRCATFYTKQLAQHIALGVLEDEQLVNNISVAVP